MNNAVYHGSELIGFRCSRCGEVFSQMWGTVCNGCRKTSDENAALRKEIRELKEAMLKQNK